MESVTWQEEEVAVDRLKTYCRSLGLEDAVHLERVSRELLARADGSAAGARISQRPIEQAVEALIEAVEEWLDSLVAAVAPPQRELTRALLLWRLRELLKEHPEAFLNPGGFPDDCRPLLVQPAPPRPFLAAMARQPLGRIPRPLRTAYWRWFIRRVARLFRKPENSENGTTHASPK